MAVTLSLIDYPLGVAWDELVKLRGVRTGRYAYYHPLFMIDLAQAAALVLQPPDLPSLAHLVRVLGALAGGVMVFATFSLARLVLPNLPALAAAAASAVNRSSWCMPASSRRIFPSRLCSCWRLLR